MPPNLGGFRSEERFSRNAETDLVCRLLLEKKKENWGPSPCQEYTQSLYPLPLIYASGSLFFFTATASTEIYTLSLHDALPILLPILGTISGKTVKLMVLALICLGNNRQD